MKKNALALGWLMALLLCFHTNSFARIWRVNNTPGIAADFTTAQAAHDAAAAGDTIHFEPSSTAYGNLTISKQLVLVSLGSFLGDNPGLQYSAVSGTLGTVTVGVAGCVLMINASGIFINNGIGNTTLLRCRVTGTISLTNSDNTIIINCFANIIGSTTGSTGLIIRNNIVGAWIDLDNQSAAEISNNVIGAISSNSSVFYNSSVKNNIFNKSSGLGGSSGNTFTNNLAVGNYLPAGNGNQNNVNMATVFVNPNGSVDNHFMLQTAGANPAQGAGEGGIDCGAFGGTSAFKPGMIPPIPSIYKLEVPALPSGNTLNIVISTRSNN